jgi:hypothetical protein
MHDIKLYLEDQDFYSELPCSLPTSSRINGIQIGEISKLG